MGFRFRKSFRLFPGLRLNFSKNGISTSVGVPGATVNLGRRGLRGTVGIPGSGLSYSDMLVSSGGAKDKPGASSDEIATMEGHPMVENSKISATPAIATWELWTTANILISTHGEAAEQHAQDELDSAIAQHDEGGEIVWRGVITQLAKIRGGNS